MNIPERREAERNGLDGLEEREHQGVKKLSRAYGRPTELGKQNKTKKWVYRD